MPAGAKFGRFRVLGAIGQDSTGYLYRARQEEGNRLVALRVLDGDRSKDTRVVELADRAVRLRHKNVQQCLLLGRQGKSRYFAFEYTPGSSLRRRLERGETMKPYRSLRVIWRVARALRAAGRKGLAHGDLRPSSIQISATGTVKVSGIGMPLEVSGEFERFQAPRGSIPFYAAPEEMKDRNPSDERRTVFTLGAILYHMVTGQAPLFGDTLKEAMLRYADHGIEPAERVNPKLPRPVALLLARMLAPYSHRMEGLDALIQAIGELAGTRLAERSGTAPEAATPESTEPGAAQPDGVAEPITDSSAAA
ncbi:MAG: serine/threonine protein kinase [Planctomycetes bacterium]|nr:serine/threonine protein kinase [Planctomycetota bacterium]